ncbi:MAG TPA: DUF1003 domain-containing protein [Mycobacteriales bacterium]
MAEPRARLDQPREDRRVILRPTYDADAFGRVSERIARFFGTAKYLVIQTAIVLVWIAYNGWTSYSYFVLHSGPRPFDKYPFILLNLAFSTQAAYAAPLILLAQNRQSDRDRVQLEEDRARAARTVADTEFLARELAAVRIAVGEVVTRDFLRSELRAILEELDVGDHPPKKDKKKKPERVAELPPHPLAEAAAPVESSASPE